MTAKSKVVALEHVVIRFSGNCPSQVSGSFQIDAQYYGLDKGLGIDAEYLSGKRMGINGFGKINYSLGNFSAGIRYEACLTPLSGFDPRMHGHGLANA